MDAPTKKTSKKAAKEKEKNTSNNDNNNNNNNSISNSSNNNNETNQQRAKPIEQEFIRQKKVHDKLKIDETRCIDANCGSTNLIEHHSDGLISCQRCGLVFPGKVVDTVSEWRTFANDSGDLSDPSRVGDAQSIFADGDFTVSIKVGNKQSDIGIARLTQNELQQTKNEKTIVKSLNEMRKICERMNLDQQLQDTCQRYYRDLMSKQVRMRGGVEQYHAAVIYIACKQNNVTRSFKEISAVTQVDSKDIARAYQVVVKELNLDVEPMQTGDFVERFCNVLGARNLVNTVRHVVDQYTQLGLGRSRKPQTIVAGAIWFVSELLGSASKHVSLTDLFDKTGVTNSAILQVQQELQRERARVLPPDFVGGVQPIPHRPSYIVFTQHILM